MASLDARLALALMAKAQAVFGSPGNILSFPITPLAFSADSLTFDDTAGFTGPMLTALADFSRWANQIPHGAAWLPTDGRLLPELYADILETLSLAEGSRSSAEEAEYQRARDFLSDPTTGVDSATYVRYKQFRDAWFVAEDDYNLARLTAMDSSDPEVRKHWAEVVEPATRARLDELAANWATQGHREEVESALQTISKLGEKDPNVTWSAWKSHTDPSLFGVSDLNGVRFMPTFISPSNTLIEGWQSFTLTGEESNRLMDAADAELQARLGAGALDLDLDSLTFEYSSAQLVRNWFDPATFSARFWKFADPNRVISAGKEPYAGECPLYASGVVFARKIRGTLRPNSPKNDVVIATLVDKPLNLGTVSLCVRVAEAEKPAPTPAPVDARLAPADLVSAASGPVTVATPPRGVVATPPHTRDKVIARDSGLIRQARFLADEVRPQEPSPVPTPQTPVLEPTAPNEIFVLAFICQKVPRCPNPDPQLRWPS